MIDFFEPLPEEYSVIALVGLTLLGACVGSFLNVVVYRLPRGMSVQNPPRSFCPACGAGIPWWLNLPIVSWLWLRGRSACCHKRISVRYWLVEVACSALFFVVGWYFCYEGLVTQLALCMWGAAMLALLAMDWEEMVVHPWVAALAACVGLFVAAMDPTLVEGRAVTPQEGALWSLAGAGGGYLLFRLVALCGRLFFGRRKRVFGGEEAWLLRQVGEDIVLSVAGRDYPWSEVFPEAGGRLVLLEAGVKELPGGEAARGEVCLQEEAISLPDGTRHELAGYERLSGVCRGVVVCREAMGSGDAWLALAIGALCGWQGVVFALVGGSVIGLLFAAAMRVRRGVPMPFGPALILAAYVWLFWGPQLVELYLKLAL